MPRRTARTGRGRSVALSSLTIAAAAVLGAPGGTALADDAQPSDAVQQGTATPTEGAAEPTAPVAVEQGPDGTATEDTDGSGTGAGAEPVDGGQDLPSEEPAAAPTVLDELVDGSPPAAPESRAARSQPAEQAAVDEEVFAADFGDGKAEVSFGVSGLAGTPYPEDADLSGAELEVEYSNALFVFAGEEPQFLPEDGSFTCTTGSDGFCDETVLLDGGGTVTVTQLTAPAGFLVPEDAVLAEEDATCEPSGLPPGAFTPEQFCSLVFQDPGVFRTLGVELTSSVDGRPLAGGTFELCEPAEEAECDTLTTGDDGTGLFDGLYLPGEYGIEQTSAPEGYVAADDLSLEVPAATSVEQAEVPVVLPVENDADVPPPTAVDDAASTPSGSSVEVPVLGNDDGAGAPLSITAVGETADGTVQVVERADCAGTPDCPDALRFTPDSGFSGTTTFTYTASTRGGSDTATVTVTVVAPAVAPTGVAPARVDAGRLPTTGAELGPLLAASAALLGGGGLLLLGGRRSARRELEP